jgi:hypothetical protein
MSKAIRKLENYRENIIIVDDIEQEQNHTEKLELFKKNHALWFEHYFPQFLKRKSFISERQKISLGVKKRYSKVPKIKNGFLHKKTL